MRLLRYRPVYLLVLLWLWLLLLFLRDGLDNWTRTGRSLWSGGTWTGGTCTWTIRSLWKDLLEGREKIADTLFPLWFRCLFWLWRGLRTALRQGLLRLDGDALGIGGDLTSRDLLGGGGDGFDGGLCRLARRCNGRGDGCHTADSLGGCGGLTHDA